MEDRKISILLLLSIFTMVTISCSNDVSDGDYSGRVPMNFTTEIIDYTTTRFSGDGSFENDDKIGLYVTGKNEKISGYRTHDNELLTYSNGKLVSKETLYFSGTSSSYDFIAYYPYSNISSQAGSTLIPLSVQADQSSSSNFYTSDFMVAYTSSEATVQKIKLPFKHKLCLVDIIITTSDKDVCETAQKSSSFTLANVYTSAYYDTDGDTIKELSDMKDITMYGSLKLSQASSTTRSDEDSYKLEGVKFLAIPQNLEGNNLYITIGGKTRNCPFSIGTEMESGHHYRISIKYNSTTSEFEFESYTIDSWPDAEDTNSITTVEAPYLFKLSSIDFSESLVYRLYNADDKLMGQICKEYLYVNGVIDASAIVYYPNCNLKKGEVLQIIGGSDNSCGGSVSWNNDGTLTYSAGMENSINTLVLNKDGSITTTNDESSCTDVTSKPYTLDDTRDGESNIIKYPIVKIGAQYWMASELHATRYNDGESISCNDSDYKTLKAGYYTKDDDYFYNTAAVKTGKLAPNGWHLPKPAELSAMKNYLGTDAAYKLKAESGWNSHEGVSQGTNITGFNARAIGCYYYDSTAKSVSYKYNGQFLLFWTMNEAGNDINSCGLFISNQDNDIQLTGKLSIFENLGCPVRCLRNN
jgi:uncharacterized protein (TIGR02145 family)